MCPVHSWICLQDPVQRGTLRYMSPEILEGCVNLKNNRYMLPADVYSLALLLWEIWMCCSDFSNGTLSWYLQNSGGAADRTFSSLFVSPSVYRQSCSTASAAIWIWARSQCIHREPHFACMSHGHEAFHTATLESAVTGIPKYIIDVVNILWLTSFITCRGLPWRRSWQIVGTLIQMPAWLLSVLRTDWSLFSLAIMDLLSTYMLLFVSLLFSCIQMLRHSLLHLAPSVLHLYIFYWHLLLRAQACK